MIAVRVWFSEVWARGPVRFDPDQQIGQFEAQGRYGSVRGEPFKQGAKSDQFADKGLGKTRIFGDHGLCQDPGLNGGAGR
jgi:hypothetical protein